MKIDRMETRKLNLASPFDRYLWTVSVYEYCRKIESGNPKLYKRSARIPSSLSDDWEKILVILDDSLEETLIKIAVEMFTKYHELKYNTLVTMGLFPDQCKIVSHFQALYYYRKGEYDKLLKTCDSIISREIFRSSMGERNRPKFLPAFRDPVFYTRCVSVLFAFQGLFRQEIICLTGLIALIDRKLFRLDKYGDELLDKLKQNADISLLRLKYDQGKFRGTSRYIIQLDKSQLPVFSLLFAISELVQIKLS